MLKTTKSLLRSLALSVTIIYGALVAPELHNQYLRYEVGESVVQVLHPTLNGGGTGFAVEGKSGKRYIMTNYHVCGVAVDNIVRIVTADEETIYRKIVYKDNLHDLCLIDGIKGLDPLTLGEDQVPGDYHYVVGHPGLRQLTTSIGEYIGRTTVDLPFDVPTRSQCPGTIIELNPIQQFIYGMEFACMISYPALGTSAVIYGGNSGSPVVNRWGNLIGVAFAGNPQQERDNFLIPLFYVKRVLNKF